MDYLPFYEGYLQGPVQRHVFQAQPFTPFVAQDNTPADANFISSRHRRPALFPIDQTSITLTCLPPLRPLLGPMSIVLNSALKASIPSGYRGLVISYGYKGTFAGIWGGMDSNP